MAGREGGREAAKGGPTDWSPPKVEQSGGLRPKG